MTSQFQSWVDEIARLTRPNQIRIISGNQTEREELVDLLIEAGTMIRLNPEKRPNSFLTRTDPRDVARVESRTYICSAAEEEAGPTNNWVDPAAMRARLDGLFAGSMVGRTMYVIPFSMGTIGGSTSRYGVEITDSPYVVLSMMTMTRVDRAVIDLIDAGASWVPAIHSVGQPLTEGQPDVAWPCNPEKVHVVHFPETYEIWSYGSGYGGNSLLGKKAMSLRIGSSMARQEGWLAEHMLLVRVTAPNNKTYHLAGAFPSACGKTNLAMLQPSIPGYKVQTIGDDIAWISKNSAGELRAINPENGLFGVAPGTGYDTNPVAMEAMRSDALFTNVALTDDGDVWWEGMSDTPPENLTDWQGQPWDPSSGKKAAHPNSRFCVPMENCPTTPGDWDNDEGVKLDAILFGGRRATNVPLVMRSYGWTHGVFLGATIASEQTAAAEGTVGELRRDPFAMLPFCGYNMADYWQHWIEVGTSASNPPAIFQVNWFRKDDSGKFIWPGFSENSRVIDWIIRSIEGEAEEIPSAIGILPNPGDIEVSGLDLEQEKLEELFRVDAESWSDEVQSISQFFAGFGAKLPQLMQGELEALQSRLKSSALSFETAR